MVSEDYQLSIEPLIGS